MLDEKHLSFVHSELIREVDEYDESSSSEPVEPMYVSDEEDGKDKTQTPQPSMAATDLTFDNQDSDEDKKWKLHSLVELQVGSQKMVDFGSCQDRLFILFENMHLTEVSLKTKNPVAEVDLSKLESIETDEPALAFAIFSELNMLAVSTTSHVWLVDFENEFRFNQRVDVPMVTYIAYIDIYMVFMQSLAGESVFSCRMMYGDEEGRLAVQGAVQACASANCIIFSCGTQLGRLSLPEMELQY